MEKHAVHFLSVDQAREQLREMNDDQRYQYVQIIYRALPSNLSMSIEEFIQLADEFAPTFTPTQLDNRIAVNEHAARPDTLNAVRAAKSQAHIDFLKKLEYISQSDISDDTRNELNRIISKVMTHYIK